LIKNICVSSSRSFTRYLALVFVSSSLCACGAESLSELNATALEVALAADSEQEVDLKQKILATRSAAFASSNQEKPAFRWSDEGFWGGKKPVAGSHVLVPAGVSLILDESPPKLASLTVQGKLELDRSRPIDISADYIVVSGSLLLGSADSPLTKPVSITLTGKDKSADVMGMGTRGLFVNGGRLEMHGISPKPTAVVLGDHASLGTRILNTAVSVDWKAGDDIVVSPTDYYGFASTEKHTVVANNGNEITIAQPLEAFRWGKLQYVNKTGVSLVKDANFVPLNAGTPTVLDERAVVSNLRRNIVFQSVSDDAWLKTGFGAQLMVMGAKSNVIIDGVEFRRVGQADIKGRYPIHFHQLSYDQASGLEIPKEGNRLVKNNAIWDSQNRCITLHGTNDVDISNNTCFNILGHAIFLEDAVERRNRITNNLVLRVRTPPKPLINSDIPKLETGPSGFWITNPDNLVRGNRAADTEGNGFWLAFPFSPLGLNKNAKNGAAVMRPNNMKFGVFDDNTAHSNKSAGIQIDFVPIDEAGNVAGASYVPTSDEGLDRFDQNRVRFSANKNVIFKNRFTGFWNRVTKPTYSQWIAADNEGLAFAGAGADGVIQRSLVVGTSLNNANSWRSVPSLVQPVAFASYHSTFSIVENLAVNFDYVANKPSGVFSTQDYYTNAIDKGFVRNTNNQLINAFSGSRAPVQSIENWTFAGALWDPFGFWGRAGNYWTYDEPFFTHDVACQKVQLPNGDPSNSASCAAEFYGVGEFWTETSKRYLPKMPLKVTRFDVSGRTVGSWTVGDGNIAPKLGQMRHFAATRKGRYLLEFVGKNVGDIALVPAQFLQLLITNAYRPEDEFILGVPFSGVSLPRVILENPNGTVNLASVSSLAQVEASAGNVFWQDNRANVIWVKAKTPSGSLYPNEKLDSDLNQYRGYYLRIDK
jgi:G8 domain/Right handed beta helix region